MVIVFRIYYVQNTTKKKQYVNLAKLAVVTLIILTSSKLIHVYWFSCVHVIVTFPCILKHTNLRFLVLWTLISKINEMSFPFLFLHLFSSNQFASSNICYVYIKLTNRFHVPVRPLKVSTLEWRRG